MGEAIALSSPSGRMSGRARAAADARLRVALFGPTGHLPAVVVPQPSRRAALLHQAAELRELAARGMKPRAYRRRADELEREAAAANPRGPRRPRIETYRIQTAAGRPIRRATKVVFPDGREVKFLERVPWRLAIPQAEAVLAQQPAPPTQLALLNPPRWKVGDRAVIADPVRITSRFWSAQHQGVVGAGGTILPRAILDRPAKIAAVGAGGRGMGGARRVLLDWGPDDENRSLGIWLDSDQLARANPVAGFEAFDLADRTGWESAIRGAGGLKIGRADRADYAELPGYLKGYRKGIAPDELAQTIADERGLGAGDVERAMLRAFHGPRRRRGAGLEDYEALERAAIKGEASSSSAKRHRTGESRPRVGVGADTFTLRPRSPFKGGIHYVNNPRRPPARVQSLLFPKTRYSIDQARAWARAHGYKTSDVDTGDGLDFIHLRQRPPHGLMRTIVFGDGIEAVIQRPTGPRARNPRYSPNEGGGLMSAGGLIGLAIVGLVIWAAAGRARAAAPRPAVPVSPGTFWISDPANGGTGELAPGVTAPGPMPPWREASQFEIQSVISAMAGEVVDVVRGIF